MLIDNGQQNEDLLPIKLMKIADLENLFNFNARVTGDGLLVTGS